MGLHTQWTCAMVILCHNNNAHANKIDPIPTAPTLFFSLFFHGANYLKIAIMSVF